MINKGNRKHIKTFETHRVNEGNSDLEEFKVGNLLYVKNDERYGKLGVKILPRKREFLTHGERKSYIKKVNWVCDLELINDNGTMIKKAVQYMSPTDTKREAVSKAKEEVERILNKGDFYFKF